MRVKITISYDGSNFFGSQKQTNKKTVQGELEKALKKLNILSNTVFSGRTDKGVHALCQIVSLVLPPFWTNLNRLKNKLNNIIDKSIQIKYIKKASDNFNARFDAKKRVYRYIISRKELSPFNKNYFLYKSYINLSLVNNAIKLFIGKHDFKYFHKIGSETNNTICIIDKTFCYEYKDFYIFYFSANRFLRSQIRIMVNFLINLSDKKLTISQLKEQLECKKLYFNKPIKPNGLYLSKIKFEK